MPKAYQPILSRMIHDRRLTYASSNIIIPFLSSLVTPLTHHLNILIHTHNLLDSSIFSQRSNTPNKIKVEGGPELFSSEDRKSSRRLWVWNVDVYSIPNQILIYEWQIVNELFDPVR